MLDIPFVKEFLLIFIIALFTVLIFNRLKIPSIVGLLTAGILMGPSALKVIEDPHVVETFTDLGLIPLLFVVGIEFSVTELKRLRQIALWGGGFQVLTISATVAVIMLFTGFAIEGSLFLGFVVALSSTALLVKILTDKLEIDTPHGKILIGILLAQDLFVIILMFLLPIFGTKASLLSEGIIKFVTAIAVIFLVYITSQKILPKAFSFLASVKDREIFTIAIFIFVLGIVWLTSLAGLSVALGAFLAGIIISEQEYKHYAAAQILPFKDILSSLFFISIGMLFDVDFFISNVFLVLFITLTVIVIKAFFSTLSALVLKYPLRVALLAGFGLAQLGEFSFVIAESGKGFELITENQFQMIMAVTIITLFMTPALMRLSSALGYAFSKVMPSQVEHVPELSNHTVVLGYGLNGRNLAKVLKSTSISYIVMDLNPSSVEEGKEMGHNVVFGDVTQRESLKRIGIERARICVIAMSDRLATERALSLIKMMNPNLRIVVRTRYVADVKRLFDLGASQVIPEEFETSVEIFIRVLREYRIPGNVITSQVAFVRQDGYRVFRGEYAPEDAAEKLMDFLKESATETFLVKQGSIFSGKSLREIKLREETGATIIAVIRSNKSYVSPKSDFSVKEGDVFVLIGSHAELDSAYKFMEQ
jgi:CPA2 family monovalent cation:H+ antiporter-2